MKNRSVSLLLLTTLTSWCVHAFRLAVIPKLSRNVLVGATKSTSSYYPQLEDLLYSNTEFERRCQIDATIRALQIQLPLTLTKPLTTISARGIFEEQTQLSVLIANDDDQNDDDDEKDEIVLLTTREELVALSDVLVLTTSAAKSVLGDTTTQVDCQILVDPSCHSLVIPWTAQVPRLPGGPTSSSSSSNARLNSIEGLSEFRLNPQGKIHQHLIRKVSWNGQSLNGPAIGQALKALQSTMTTIQNSPLWGIMGNRDIWSDVRDGLLEQVATVAAASSSSSSSTSSRSSTSSKTNGSRQGCVVIPVESVENCTSWVDPSSIKKDNNQSLLFQPKIPLPGTKDWQDYTLWRVSIWNLCEQVIPSLSTITTSSTSKNILEYFVANATLRGTQGSVLVQGRDSIVQFFQGLSLTRQSTGGTWELRTIHIPHWKSRQIIMEYMATNTPWIFRGQDIYTINANGQIQDIKQDRLEVTSRDGSITLDGSWLMKSLALAVERSDNNNINNPSTMGPKIQDFFADLLFQQQQQQTSASSSIPKQKISQQAAANTFYFMSELHQSIPGMWNETLPPGVDYLADTIELKGYLGETLLRGSNIYSRALASLMAATRQSLGQKRVLIDADPTARIELTHKGNVRLFLNLAFRVPPPLGFPDTAAVPLSVEIVSDYKFESQAGLIREHKLVETRINGQLTPGDVVSRNLQRLWNLEQDTALRSNDDLLQTVADTLSWLRTLSTGPKK